jgi:hypothetical protein
MESYITGCLVSLVGGAFAGGLVYLLVQYHQKQKVQRIKEAMTALDDPLAPTNLFVAPIKSIITMRDTTSRIIYEISSPWIQKWLKPWQMSPHDI